MMLRISPSLQHLVQNKNYSSEVWTTLNTTFGVQGPALIYAEFCSALMIKIPAASPVLEINRMATVFGRLATESIAIPQVVQAMLLLAACLREYDSVSSTVLQTHTNSTLTFDIVRNAIVADAQRRVSVSKLQQPAVANKISSVKRKGPNPSWQPKQPQQGESSGNNGNNKDNKGNSSHGKCGGKDKKKEKKKQHGNLASVAINPFTTVTGSGSIIPPVPLLQRLADVPATKDPRKQQPAQRFISASSSDSSSSVFPNRRLLHRS
jgi:hypothetical protein